MGHFEVWKMFVLWKVIIVHGSELRWWWKRWNSNTNFCLFNI